MHIDRLNFWRHVQVQPSSGCWLWSGKVSTSGYGRVRLGKKEYQAHRVCYESCAGPIAQGLDIDHLCRVRNCVNPRHLEPVTRRENLMRGATIPADHASRTHCPRGHTLAGDNLYRWRGQRSCRACRKQAWRKWYENQGRR